MDVCAHEKRTISMLGGVKTHHRRLSVRAAMNMQAESSPFHHLGTKLQTKTCAQQVTFCPSCPNRYLCNPWSVSRDSTPFVQIYMSHGRIPGRGVIFVLWATNYTHARNHDALPCCTHCCCYWQDTHDTETGCC